MCTRCRQPPGVVVADYWPRLFYLHCRWQHEEYVPLLSETQGMFFLTQSGLTRSSFCNFIKAIVKTNILVIYTETNDLYHIIILMHQLILTVCK